MNGLSGLATGAKAFLFSALRSPRAAPAPPDVVPRRLFDATTKAPAGGAETHVVAAAATLPTPGGKRKRVEEPGDAQPVSRAHPRGDEEHHDAKRQRGEDRLPPAGVEGASVQDGAEGRKRSALDILWDDMADRRVRRRLEADTAVPPLVVAASAGGAPFALASPSRRAPTGASNAQWAANTRFLFATGGAGAPGHRGGAGTSTSARAGTGRRPRVLPPAVAQLLRSAGSAAAGEAPELRPLPGDVPPPPPAPPPPPQPSFTAFTAMPAIAETHAAPSDNGAVPAPPAAGGGAFAFGVEEPPSASKSPKRSTSFGLRKSGNKGASSDSLLGAALSEMTQSEAPAAAAPTASASPAAAFTLGAAPVATSLLPALPGADTSTDGAKPAPEPAASAAAAVPATTTVAPTPFLFGASAAASAPAATTAPAPAPAAAPLFTFGATPPAPAPAVASSPIAPAAAAAAAPAFVFGAPAPAVAAAPPALAPFTFGAAPPAAAAPAAALSPGVTQPAAFVFGGAPAPQQAAAAAPFSFMGGGAASTPAAPAPAFTFGAAQPPPSAVVQPMGASMSPGPAAAFAFGAPAPIQLQQPGPSAGAPFAFGGGAPSPQLAHAFSAPPGLGMPAFGGGLAAMANGAAAMGGGFNAGAAPPPTGRRPMMKAKRPGK